MVRRKNRRQVGFGQVMASHPRFIQAAGTPFWGGPLIHIPLWAATEEPGLTTPVPYMGSMIVNDQGIYPGTSTGAAITSIEWDNGGAAGQTRIIFTIVAGLLPGESIQFPANFIDIRGGEGEWLTGGTFLLP